MAFLEGQAAIRYPVAADGDVAGQRLLPGRPARRLAATASRGPWFPSRPCRPSLLLPFVALWGARHRRPADLRDPRRDRRRAGVVGARLAADPDVGPRGRDACSSASGRSSGTPPSSGRPGTRRTSWRSAWPSLAIGVALRGDRAAAFREDEPAPASRRRASSVGVRRRAATPSAGARLAASRLARPGRPAVPRRLPVRAGLHVPADGRLRRAVLRLRRVGGGSWQRRGWSAALGAGIPLAALAVYNLVTTGSLLHPGYQHLYELEAGVLHAAELPPRLGESRTSAICPRISRSCS